MLLRAWTCLSEISRCDEKEWKMLYTVRGGILISCLYSCLFQDQSVWGHTISGQMALQCYWTCLERGWRATGQGKVRGNTACLSHVSFWKGAGPGMDWDGGAGGESRLYIWIITMMLHWKSTWQSGKFWCMFQMDVLVWCEHISCHCCTHRLNNRPGRLQCQDIPSPSTRAGCPQAEPYGSFPDPRYLPDMSVKIIHILILAVPLTLSPKQQDHLTTTWLISAQLLLLSVGILHRQHMCRVIRVFRGAPERYEPVLTPQWLYK